MWSKHFSLFLEKLEIESTKNWKPTSIRFRHEQLFDTINQIIDYLNYNLTENPTGKLFTFLLWLSNFMKEKKAY